MRHESIAVAKEIDLGNHVQFQTCFPPRPLKSRPHGTLPGRSVAWLRDADVVFLCHRICHYTPISFHHGALLAKTCLSTFLSWLPYPRDLSFTLVFGQQLIPIPHAILI